jgi:hypothetical protein
MNDQEEELTDAQIERQDLVDGAIYQLLRQLAGLDEDNPSGDDLLPWNIEEIASVRDKIETIVASHGLMAYTEFYPGIALNEFDEELTPREQAEQDYLASHPWRELNQPYPAE